jgi:glycosyltransferase involved in cell wall biosynthesis
VVHVSNRDIGGAEASLQTEIAAMAKSAPLGSVPIFLIPAEGPLARAVAARGWEARLLPWPRGYADLTQTRWRSLFRLPGMIPYLVRLALAVRGSDLVWSSGVKSHAACLMLSPWLRERLLFDVRDFLRAPILRRAIAFAAARFGCRVAANSRAVAAGYPGAEVRYPRLTLARPAVERRSPGGRRVVTHLAYYAPYKGQSLFLQCARALLDAGVDAEFRLIGDVLYPAPEYDRYRQAVRDSAAQLGLGDRVRFLGQLDAGQVQTALEETHLLLHCTLEPEPFGRAPMEALLCGCEVICRSGSGVCEVADVEPGFPEWARGLRSALGEEFVSLRLRSS